MSGPSADSEGEKDDNGEPDSTQRQPSPSDFDQSASKLPSGYWRSITFIGSYAAIAFGYAAGAGAFSLIVPILDLINSEIGPSDNITWVALTPLLANSVLFLVVGRFSDLFGRRWFFAIGSVIGLIGSIAGATAPSVTQLIISELLTGIAGGFQFSYFWVISELVPMRHRYIAVAGFPLIAMPTSGLATKVAITIATQTSVGWRGCYYILIALNAASAICYYLFYHPPTFKMLHRRLAVATALFNFDWIGMMLYISAATLFLLGLNWGGQMYPWASSRVLGALVGGVASFGILILWELYLPIKEVEPFFPLQLFRNLQFQVCAWLTALAAMTFFGFTLIWPDLVSAIYPDLAPNAAATVATIPTLCFMLGSILGGPVGTVLGPRPGTIVCIILAAPLLGASCVNLLNMPLTLGLIIPATFFIGVQDTNTVACSTFPLRSQREIGVAGGLCGSIRALGSVAATAVLSAVQRSRLSSIVARDVVPAVSAAGLPPSSIKLLIQALQSGQLLKAGILPGLTKAIAGVATHAYTESGAQAYKTVVLVIFALYTPALVLCWFIKQNDASMRNMVAVRLHMARKSAMNIPTDTVP